MQNAPAATGRLEYWPTSEGLHIVEIVDYTIRQVGVLWGVEP